MSDFCQFLKSSSHARHCSSSSGSASESTRRLMQRLLIVSSRSFGRVVSMKIVVPFGGSSRVFRKAFAAAAFMRSAS